MALGPGILLGGAPIPLGSAGRGPPIFPLWGSYQMVCRAGPQVVGRPSSACCREGTRWHMRAQGSSELFPPGLSHSEVLGAKGEARASTAREEQVIIYFPWALGGSPQSARWTGQGPQDLGMPLGWVSGLALFTLGIPGPQFPHLYRVPTSAYKRPPSPLLRDCCSRGNPQAVPTGEMTLGTRLGQV